MISRDNILGLMLGCAAGDSFGMPMEGMDHRQIKRSYGRVTMMMAHPKYDKPPGSWTDDTQLTKVVFESLGKCNCFNLDDMAIRHMDAYSKRDGRGWGSTTMTAVNRMVREIAPQDAGKLGSAGTGTAMKAAPLGVFAYLSRLGIQWLKEVVPPFSTMTHKDVRAVCGAGAQAVCALEICKSLEKNRFPDGEDVLGEAILFSREMESRYGELSPHYIEESSDPDNIYSNKLVRVMEWYRSSGDEKDLLAAVGSGFYVNEAGPFSLGVFLKYGVNFQDCVTRAANAGGDTDSTAAMVGSLSGLFLGAEKIPGAWKDKLEDAEGLLECADFFWDMIKAE